MNFIGLQNILPNLFTVFMSATSKIMCKFYSKKFGKKHEQNLNLPKYKAVLIFYKRIKQTNKKRKEIVYTERSVHNMH